MLMSALRLVILAFALLVGTARAGPVIIIDASDDAIMIVGTSNSTATKTPHFRCSRLVAARRQERVEEKENQCD